MTRTCWSHRTRRLLARLHLNRLEDRVVPAFPFGLGNPGFGYGNDVAVDAAGNVFVAGWFELAAVDFDPGIGEARLSILGESDYFLAKYDAGGDFLWVRRIGGTGFDYRSFPGLAVDPAGNVYFAESFSGTGGVSGVDSTTRTEYVVRDGLASLTTRDGLVAKFGPSGGLVWVNQYRGGAGDVTFPSNLAVDATGVAYVTGGNGVIGGSDAFVAKFNADGSLAWTRSFGAAGEDFGNAIAVAADGGAYVVGNFSATVAFGGITLTSRGNVDAFVARLDAAGAFVWARRMGGTGLTARGTGIGIYRDPATMTEFVSVTGNFSPPVGAVGGPADFGDPANPGDTGAVSLPNYGGWDPFVSRLTAAGNFLWTRQFASTQAEFVFGQAVDAAGGVYTTGELSSSTPCDFDLNNSYPDYRDLLTNPSGTTSAFVAKLDGAGNFTWARRLGPPPGSSSGGAVGYGLIWDATSNAVFVTGSYSGTFDTGEGVLSGQGNRNVFVAKLMQQSTPPTAAAVVNDGTAQRSMVTRLAVTFSTAVTLDPGAFALQRAGGTTVALNQSVSVLNGRTVAVLTFTGPGTTAGSLDDGLYTLTVSSGRVRDAQGNALDGDGDGVAGGDYRLALHRQYGDVNGDKAVNGLDFAAFRAAFGTSPVDSSLLAAFDFNGDGAVNGLDFAAFRGRFGQPPLP